MAASIVASRLPTFIVGTGRCGSTMLSNMLRGHPHVLSLSEFFSIVTDAGRMSSAFSIEPIEGRRFWAILAAASPRNNFALQHGIAAPELLYPSESPAARFTTGMGIPSILIATIPHLTADHDSLFEILRDEVQSWPTAPISEHYRCLFESLAERFDKWLWVERSGSSLYLVRQLLELFPDARFVHLVRDGQDAALSMQAHLGFRLGFVMASLGQFLGVDPIASSDRTKTDRVPEAMRNLLPENFDAAAFRAFRVPLPLLGELWSQQIDVGLKALSALTDQRLLTLRYEDFFVDPKHQLDTFTSFLGDEFVDNDWSTRCAATMRQPKSTWRDLPPAEARTLAEACRPGFEQLSSVGVHYDF